MRDFELLRQFLELARTLHFSRAAAALHVTPSTLSRSMQRLERDLGVELFDRQHHRVELTPEGEALRRHAAEVLEGWSAFEETLRSGAGPVRGVLHMYCTVTAAQSIVPQLLGRFRESHPDVRLELVTGYAADALDQLRGGLIDASIAPVPDVLPTGVVMRPVATTPVVLVAPRLPGPVRDLVDRSRIRWSDVPFVLPAQGLVRDLVDAWTDRRGVDPPVYAQIQGHEAILALVALGCGVGVVPRLVLESSALRDRVREVVVNPPIGDLEIGLCVRERSLANPVVGALWALAA
jgi:LysR family positive regulator for ilvC